jgi:hypothetical protein
MIDHGSSATKDLTYLLASDAAMETMNSGGAKCVHFVSVKHCPRAVQTGKPKCTSRLVVREENLSS